MNEFYVYGYADPNSDDPYFYIGKGQGDRVTEHLYLSSRKRRKDYFHNKLNKLLNSGIVPIISFLKFGISESEAFDFEIELIARYGRLDLGTGCLCNLTDGGEGSTGWSPGIETKIKMSHKIMPDYAKERIHESLIISVGRKICAIDIITNEIRFVFECIADVKKKGFIPSNVHDVLSGKRKRAHGYLWEDYPRKEITKTKDCVLREYIVAIDPCTKTIMYRFNNIIDVKHKGFDTVGVSHTLHNRQRTHAGLLWSKIYE